MATARNIIVQAARRANILAGEEALTSSEAQDILVLLNNLLFGFPARGINYTHATLTLTDAVNLPSQTRNLVLLLTWEIMIDFGIEPNEGIVKLGLQAEQQLQAAYPVGIADNTALGVCYQAFRRLRLATDGEGKVHPSLNWSFVTATASADALRILNDMMFGLPARGINYTHSTLAADDPVPIGAGNIRNFVLLLVHEFALHFAVTMAKDLAIEIVKAEQQLQAAFPPTMDSTVLGLINRALQRIRVTAGSGNGGPSLPWFFVSATTSAEAVRTFNTMMHGLGPRGIAYAHTTLAAGDTVNMPDEQIRNLVLLLVKEFADANAILMPPTVALDVAGAERQLQAAYHVQRQAGTDPALSNRTVGAFDIRSGR